MQRLCFQKIIKAKTEKISFKHLVKTSKDLSVGMNFSNFTQKNMSQILAFAGSNSSKSINFSLLQLAIQNISKEQLEIMDLSTIDLPVYSIDIEKNEGFPPAVSQLFKHIQNSQGLIIAVNEHNGSISAFFKNILDWLSRVELKFLAEKKLLLLSTSPGGRGAMSALQQAENMTTHFGGQVIATFSLPAFQTNFSLEESKITHNEKQLELTQALNKFLSSFES